MEHQLIYSLIAGVSIAGAAGYLGSLMLTRRMTLVVDPLAHLTLPGIALALLYGFDISLGVFPFLVLGIFLIWLLSAFLILIPLLPINCLISFDLLPNRFTNCFRDVILINAPSIITYPAGL